MKELKGTMLYQNYRRSQEEARAPSIAMPLMTTIYQKKPVFSQFLLASLRTTVHAYNSN